MSPLNKERAKGNLERVSHRIGVVLDALRLLLGLARPVRSVLRPGIVPLRRLNLRVQIEILLPVCGLSIR